MSLEKLQDAIASKDEKPEKYGAITVEKAALVLSDVTISTANIARLHTTSSSKEAKHGMTSEAKSMIVAMLILGLILTVALGALVNPGLIVAGLLVTVVGIAAYAGHASQTELQAKSETFYLTVHTNDGGRYMFWAPKGETIDTVRRIITDKINNTNEPTVYNINFETGVIENMGIGSIGKIGSVGAIVSGSNNQVTGVAGEGRLGTVETTQITRIDYSGPLGVVASWRAHYESQGDKELAGKFRDLETLLAGGTPTGKEKSRLKSLLGELGAIFSASAHALNLFDQIRKLAGL